MYQVQKILDCSSCGEHFDCYLNGSVGAGALYKATCPKCNNDTRFSFPHGEFFSLEAAKGVKIEKIADF